LFFSGILKIALRNPCVFPLKNESCLIPPQQFYNPIDRAGEFFHFRKNTKDFSNFQVALIFCLQFSNYINRLIPLSGGSFVSKLVPIFFIGNKRTYFYLYGYGYSLKSRNDTLMINQIIS